MGLAAALARQAGVDLRKVGALRLIAFADAQPFLDACLVDAVRVIGVEGFFLKGDRAEPDMRAIADFSGLTDSAESISEARTFINAAGRPGMLFDFTLSKELARS